VTPTNLSLKLQRTIAFPKLTLHTELWSLGKTLIPTEQNLDLKQTNKQKKPKQKKPTQQNHKQKTSHNTLVKLNKSKKKKLFWNSKIKKDLPENPLIN